MSISILTTKLFIPTHRPGMVTRPQLVEQLNVGQENKLILISAPAGYGKTTLLAEWINQLAAPVGWVSLDARDNDLNRFFSYLIASLRNINIQVKEDALARMDQRPDLISEFLSLLIHQVSSLLEPIYLVFDDYHRIDNLEIHQALTYLLENLPQNLHLVIATRSDPPLRLAKLRAKGELCEIRVDDLRFTHEEAIEYLNQHMSLGLSQADISALMNKTEGWVVGLQLAGISLNKHPDKHRFVLSFAGDDRYIADYLFDEAFNRQPDHIQSFLLQTSILEQFNAQLCDAVTKEIFSQTILVELDRANLFLVPLDSQRNWYRYHHLFGDLLHNRLQHTLPGMIQELHSRASFWYAQVGYLHQAATHAIQAKDIPQLEHLIQDNMLALLETGESLLFKDQLSSFYASFKEPNLWVCIARAWSSVFAGQISSTKKALQEAESLIANLNAENDLSQLNKALGHISTIRAYIASLSGETTEEKKYARNALALLPADDYATIAYAYMMLASASLRAGENSQAEAACLAAIRASEAIPDSYIMIDVLCMLSQLQHMKGELHKTNRTLEKALEIAAKRPTLGFRHFPIIGFAKIRKSSILYEWNKLEQAEEILKQGIAMIENWGEKDSYLAGVLQSVLVFQSKGNTEQAFRMVRQGKAAAEGLAFSFGTFEVLEIWLHAKNGNWDRVDQWLKIRSDLFSQPPTFSQEFVYRFLVEILLLQGDFTRAEKTLKSLLPVVEQSDSIDRLIRSLILHARVLNGLGDTEEAISTLAHALELAQPSGYIRVFINGGEEIAQLLYQCVQRDIHQRYCSKLLESFASESQTSDPIVSDLSPEVLIEPLSPREVEVLQLIAAGYTNQEIAQDLIVSLYTVKSHARNIFSKLGVKNRTEAVAKARLYGLLQED